MLTQLKRNSIMPNLYIVTPFVVIQDKLRQLVGESDVLRDWIQNPNEWIYERIGTVHTVQGREDEAVIFVLGCQGANQTGSRNWAGGQPNLLNVAVTRAKEVFYVIGNRKLWRDAGVFRELSNHLP